jgi:hypothetical protein
MQKNSNTQRKQRNRKNLQDKEKLNQYRQSLYNKLESAEECQDINTECQKIKDSVLNAATEVIQNENKEPRKEWWDDECRKSSGREKFSQNEMCKQKNKDESE